jgi:hypothetical protein
MHEIFDALIYSIYDECPNVHRFKQLLEELKEHHPETFLTLINTTYDCTDIAKQLYKDNKYYWDCREILILTPLQFVQKFGKQLSSRIIMGGVVYENNEYITLINILKEFGAVK